MTRIWSAARRAVFAIPLLLLVASAWSFRSFTVDDAFIVARYARNLREHGELAFNVGERVNALTSPVHVLVLAALHGVAADPMAVYKAFAVVVLAIALAWSAVVRFRDPADRLAYVTLTAASPFVALWSSAGLETPLLVAVIAALVGAAALPTRSRTAVTCALAILAFLIRHDSILFTLWLVSAPGGGRLARWRARACVVAAALVWLGLMTAYFGDPLPTPFYVKIPRTGGGWLVVKNVFYIANFALFSGAVLFVGRARAALEAARPLVFGLACVAAYGAWVGSAHMMFAYRLFVPYLPAVAAAGLLAGPAVPRRRLAVALGLVLGVDAALFVVLHRATVNPTALILTRTGVKLEANRLAFALGSTGFRDYVFEYPFEGADAYSDFLRALDRSAAAIERDWPTRHLSRAPGVATFAAGRLPYALPAVHVFDALGSYRARCPDAEFETAADYYHTMSDAQTAEDSAPGLELIERVPLRFDGVEEVMDVWYRRHPTPNPLPPRVRGACTARGP